MIIFEYFKKYISTNLDLYIPTFEKNKDTVPVINHNGQIIYYKKSFFDDYLLEHVNYNSLVYPHFTFVLNRDYTLWIEANLYLINLIENDSAYNEDQRIPSSRIEIHAKALQNYKFFCDEKDDELDQIHQRNSDERIMNPYWKVAKRPFSRPNIKYRNYIQERVNKGEISPRYARKILYPITAFYKFINEYFGYNYLLLSNGVIMPGKDEKALISISENVSFMVDTNESNKIYGSKNNNLGYIKDGNNTKPLTEKQQVDIFELIHNQGQPEIIISFLFSITTAARLDTTFTLRLKHFVNSLPKNNSTKELNSWQEKNKPYTLDEIYYIPIGVGTLIDAKGLEKNYNLQVPGWLMEIIKRYITSERAIKRRNRIRNPQKNLLEEYVFITQNFNPYYIAKSDPNKNLYDTMYNGGAIRVYIANYISKKINFKFKFHYLRATCLMNLNLKMEQDRKLTSSQRMRILKDFAGHTDEETTKQYLDYSQNESDRYSAYDSRGEKLLQWITDSLLINQNNGQRYD